jgi:hypothetical protein
MSNNPFDKDIFDVLKKLDRYTDQHLEWRSNNHTKYYSYILWRVCAESYEGEMPSDTLLRHLNRTQHDVFFELADMIVSTPCFPESTYE